MKLVKALASIFLFKQKPAPSPAPPPTPSSYDIINQFIIPFEKFTKYKEALPEVEFFSIFLVFGPTTDQVLKRVKDLYSFTATEQAVNKICKMAGYRWAVVVMLLTYIQYWCKKEGVSFVNSLLVDIIFKQGLPREGDFKTLWYRCKVVNDLSDNLLDLPEALKPIQLEDEEKV